jgi:hypothetical protein
MDERSHEHEHIPAYNGDCVVLVRVPIAEGGNFLQEVADAAKERFSSASAVPANSEKGPS